MMKTEIHKAILDQGLPKHFANTVDQWYLPISNDIAREFGEKQGNTILVGVQGCQGSGKSTLSEFLKVLLETNHQLNTAVLSIDDFYLTKNQRATLAYEVHPLLATRGVPGTHDVELAKNTIDALKGLTASESFRIPRFDKALDDRAPADQWSPIIGPVDVIVLEGWCVGLEAQKNTDLNTHVNDLEAQQDVDLIWRHYVNQKLASEYTTIFANFDLFVVLQAPSFSCVYDWRLLQETKLIAKQDADRERNPANRTMSPREVRHFISHYQRLTEHALKTLPSKADWLLTLGDDHTITNAFERKLR